MERIFASNTKAHWLAALENADIPSGPVNELPEVFSDPQILDRGMVVPVPHHVSDSLKLIANPIRYSATPLTRYDAPPMLGEHTEAVLGEILGLGQEEIERLRTEGVT